MAAEATTRMPGTRPAAGGLARSVAAPARLMNMAVRRLGWGVADQAVSSLTNFAVSIYIVRALGPVQFGAYSLAYVTYGFALNASRGLSTDPLMVRFAGVSVSRWRHAVGDCTGNALSVGVVTGLGSLLAGLFMTGVAREAFFALGITLPALLLQDSWRFSFFAAGRGGQAFLNDAIWGGTLIPALIALDATHHANVFTFTLAWGLTAGIGALAGMVQAKVVPRVGMALRWLRTQGDLGVRYLLEGTSSSAVMQVRGYGTGGILGLGAVGYLQSSVTLMGPMTILNLGMGLVTIPEGAKVLRRSPTKLPLFCILVSAGLAAAALAWGVVLLIAVPRGLGSWLLHGAWQPVYPLIVPQILYTVGAAIGGGAGTGLHALGAARRSLRASLIGALMAAAGALAGAFVSVAGCIDGMAAAAWVSAIIAWVLFRRAYRDYDPNTAGLGHEAGRIRGRHRRRRPISAIS